MENFTEHANNENLNKSETTKAVSKRGKGWKYKYNNK